MNGGMMTTPLTLTHFIRRAAEWFGDKPVVSVAPEGTVHVPWRDIESGARSLGSALKDLGVRPGDRVATLAWNTHRHLELHFGVPGAGAVLHTVNVRLAPTQIAAILRHSGAKAVFVDPEFTELVDSVAGDVPSLRIRVMLAEHATPGWIPYDSLVRGATPTDWPETAEDQAAGLCYTSGTTGDPKGVLYSHRALALHTLAIALPDGFGLGERDVILPAVPMFHAHAWGLPYAAAMTGASLVLPGARPTAASVADLLEKERVTFAAGVPTVWMGVLAELESRVPRLSPDLRIHSGGAPTPPSLLEAYRRRGVEILTGWGMTELSPVGMVTHPRGHLEQLSAEALASLRTSQGTPLPFVEARIVDESGRTLPRDGAAAGELEVRGPWVTARYYRSEEPDSFHDGWLRTGDVASIDALGYVRLVDRTKDLIRSGGEWISSVQLEHALVDHPSVAEAAVVAVPDPEWGERPLACVVLRGGEGGVTADDVLAPLAGRFPGWWLPERVEFLDVIPRTGTGKYDKRSLRERYR